MTRLSGSDVQSSTSSSRCRVRLSPMTSEAACRKRARISSGVAALTLLVVFLVGHRRHSDQGTSDAPALSVPSVAVLPFSDLSPQPGQEHFADGLTDEVIVALSKVPGLRVPGRASSFYFKSSQANLRAIADSLHVRTLLTATVQRVGDRVRVRAELVNATDGFQLWSESYERRLQDLFAVYDKQPGLLPQYSAKVVMTFP